MWLCFGLIELLHEFLSHLMSLADLQTSLRLLDAPHHPWSLTAQAARLVFGACCRLAEMSYILPHGFLTPLLVFEVLHVLSGSLTVASCSWCFGIRLLCRFRSPGGLPVALKAALELSVGFGQENLVPDLRSHPSGLWPVTRDQLIVGTRANLGKNTYQCTAGQPLHPLLGSNVPVTAHEDATLDLSTNNLPKGSIRNRHDVHST
mmetsp:Transcript_143799/g.261621  ORF Transcript_143799/g.261621 Transcript_143799/m.261621 type:complete len:205 (-) Transcript_143799:65-679(-)